MLIAEMADVHWIGLELGNQEVPLRIDKRQRLPYTPVHQMMALLFSRFGMRVLFEEYLDFIPDFRSFQGSLRKPLPSHIRINRLRIEPSSLVHMLKETGVPLTPASRRHDTLWLAPELASPGNLMEYYLGDIHPQALTSALAGLVLSPEEDACVLDMCASPGGKTSHCAEIMNNTGLIIANELYPSRHISLGHTLARLGVLNAVITGYQAQEFPMKQRFHFIMADVPCSCEGKFREESPAHCYHEIRGRERLPDLQKKILLRGFDLLQKDGQMLYATCTYNPLENEAVVHHLLNERNADLLPIDVEFEVEPGITQWKENAYDNRLKRAVRCYPHQIDSVGFFMAKIGRRG